MRLAGQTGMWYGEEGLACESNKNVAPADQPHFLQNYVQPFSQNWFVSLGASFFSLCWLPFIPSSRLFFLSSVFYLFLSLLFFLFLFVLFPLLLSSFRINFLFPSFHFFSFSCYYPASVILPFPFSLLSHILFFLPFLSCPYSHWILWVSLDTCR